MTTEVPRPTPPELPLRTAPMQNRPLLAVSLTLTVAFAVFPSVEDALSDDRLQALSIGFTLITAIGSASSVALALWWVRRPPPQAYSVPS